MIHKISYKSVINLNIKLVIIEFILMYLPFFYNAEHFNLYLLLAFVIFFAINLLFSIFIYSYRVNIDDTKITVSYFCFFSVAKIVYRDKILLTTKYQDPLMRLLRIENIIVYNGTNRIFIYDVPPIKSDYILNLLGGFKN